LRQAALCAAVRRGSAATGKRDTRRTARRSEAKCDRRPSGENSAGCGRLREGVPDGDGRYSALSQTACIRERMAHLTTKSRRECRRCARAERRKRLVQPWAVPTPTLSAGSRKWAECEMDDPEGNLVIVERVGHENQCPFPQTSTVGSVQHTVLNSTAHGTQLTPRIFRRLAGSDRVKAERFVYQNQA